MASLSPLQYGTVTGRFLVELGDSDDADFQPDIYPARGYLVFTPATSYANVKTAKPDPATVFPQTVIAVLDADGYLNSVAVDDKGIPKKTFTNEYIPVERGIRIQSSSDPNIIPTNWTWRVAFYLTFNGQELKYESYDFTLEPNQTLDLAYAKPTKQTSGTITVTGPKGETGQTGPKGDTGPVNVLSIGSITTRDVGQSATASITGDAPNQILNLGLPKGPVGPSGGPVPAGGSAGQIIRQTAGGGFEWFTPSGAVVKAQSLDASTNLDTLTADLVAYQATAASATTALKYPEQAIGILQVFEGATGYATQRYTSMASNKVYSRSMNANIWSAWTQLLRDTDVPTSTTGTANTYARRDANGALTNTQAFSSTALTTSSGATTLTRKDYVDTAVSDAKASVYNSSLVTTDLNTLTTPGSYSTSTSATNAPKLVGLTFGGRLTVMKAGDTRGTQTLSITTVAGTRPEWWGTNGQDFWGLTFTRGFDGTTFTPWSMIGDTPPRENGITINTTNLVTVRVPITRKLTNGKLQVQGTFDIASTLKSGQIFTLDSTLAVSNAQVVSSTEANNGWGKVSISGTSSSIYTNTAGAGSTWITFQGLWELA